MKKLLALFAMVVGVVAYAETFVLKNAPSTLADWQNGEFYQDGQAPSGVDTDKIVALDKANLSIDLDLSTQNGLDTLAFLNCINDLDLPNATLRVTVPEDKVATFNFAVHDSTQSGVLEKFGAGELYLAARLKVIAFIILAIGL